MQTSNIISIGGWQRVNVFFSFFFTLWHDVPVYVNRALKGLRELSLLLSPINPVFLRSKVRARPVNVELVEPSKLLLGYKLTKIGVPLC